MNRKYVYYLLKFDSSLRDIKFKFSQSVEKTLDEGNTTNI